MRRRLSLLIPLVISAVAYLPLNRRPRDRVLKIAADDAIPMFPPIAVPYLAFLLSRLAPTRLAMTIRTMKSAAARRPES